LNGTLSRVFDFLETDGWAVVESDEEENTLEAIFNGKEDQFGFVVTYRPDERQLVFYSICPFEVPKERSYAVMELLTRVNIGIPIGNFELDLDDDFIRYKTSSAIENAAFTLEVIRPLIYANVFLTEAYIPAIREVMGGANPNVTAVKYDAIVATESN
jgi:hypothetical protein